MTEDQQLFQGTMDRQAPNFIFEDANNRPSEAASEDAGTEDINEANGIYVSPADEEEDQIEEQK